MCFYNWRKRKARREEARWRAAGSFLQRYFQHTVFLREMYVRYHTRCWRIYQGGSPWRDQ